MIGQRISHYRIDAELGRGGMGVVYRAHDERLRRDVAVKLLSDRFSNRSEQRERILAEARAASALNHPGITTIYEVGEDGENLFLVMELVSGKTLRELAQNRPADARMVARLGHDVAEALGAAHSQSVVHGDVKPENIVVTAGERVKLLDFGIAKQAAEEAVTLTRTAPNPDDASSMISGTLAYMSPEQLRGQPLDARTDLFALGVVLYELAAGHRPFPGPTATAVMAQILREEPVPLPPETPAALARIVHKLLQKDPAARYQTARETQADLNNLVRELEMGAAMPAAVTGKRAVAVLPFALLTPNAEDEYLRVALADAVINHLTASGELLVRPTSLVARYAKQAVDPQIAARELNVQIVIEGSIQKVGQRLRVHVQAWNAAEGTAFLSAKHDGEMNELFELQDEIAAELRSAFELQHRIGARLAREKDSTASSGRDSPAQPPTRNQMAYELYLRAMERLSRLNRWDTRTAIEMLDNATKLDPRFAAAWARLAEGCVSMGILFEPGPAWFRRVNQAANCALKLDPRNAEAHCAVGRVLWTPAKGFKNREALRALNAALRLNPGCHSAQLWRCAILFHVGLLEEAREGLLEALAMHPDDPLTLVFAGQAAMQQFRYEEADEYNARALRLDRGHVWANVFYPTIAIYRGRFDEAEEKIRAAREVLPDDSWLTSCEGLLWARRGEMRKALQLTERALRGGKPLVHTHHMWNTAACVYAMAGKPQKAVSLLARCAKNGLPNYVNFNADPHLAPITRNPGFVKLMAGMKKEWEGYKKEFGEKS